MSEITYTKDELDEFDHLTEMCSSPAQMDRIMGRLDLRKFMDKHGKEKCDVMFAVLQAKDRKENVTP